ncbi:MAG: ABC transporter substrate-binding protein, partial [bacterium]
MNFIFSSFSRKERIIFVSFLFVLLLSTLSILESINRAFLVKVPLHGGALSIGIVGVPRFINPVLASGETDQDLTALIYSGLMRKSASGEIIPDLAEKYEAGDKGLTYTFTLKNNLTFQDGKELTADDVVFTVNKVKDGVIKSPEKVNWDGVIVEKIDQKTIKFTLKQPYASFLENATLGIMPAHLWDSSPLELNSANTNPIGSGPFMVDTVRKQSSGIIDSYSLVPFKKFALDEPYIQNISFRFYQNEDDLTNALLSHQVDDISSITPLNAENLKEKNYQIESAVLGRVFGLFFNQNQNQIFTDKVVTNAINQAIDKNKIVNEVLLGYGTTIDSPIPPSIKGYEVPINTTKIERSEILKKAQADLLKDGWKAGTDGILEKITTKNSKKVTTKLAFSISTGNVPELAQAAEIIRQNLADIGIKVDIKTFETGSLNQNVIRPRKYDALLFGEIINHESDLFAFWHSTQRKDPGLNIAMYTNAKVDKILEDAFVSTDEATRIKKYTQFRDEVKKLYELKDIEYENSKHRKHTNELVVDVLKNGEKRVYTNLEFCRDLFLFQCGLTQVF